MILPIGDQPNPRGFTPVVTYGLLAANIAVFLFISLPLTTQPVDINDPSVNDYVREILRRYPGADAGTLMQALRRVTAYDVFVMEWGYRPAAPSLATLFSSMFLHGGWLHLIGNMLFLWIYGDNVEHRLGRLGYLVAYLATGVAATLAFAAFSPASAGHVPLVGASGAISGVLGLYFLWFPHNKVRLLVVLFPFFMDVWLVGARIVLGFYLVIDNLLPFLLLRGQSGGVAHGAHIGGFIGGLVLAFALERLGEMLGVRRARSASREARSDFPLGGADGVSAAHIGGAFEDAVQRYLGLEGTERRRVPARTAAELADWLARQGEVDGALAVYRRALHDHPRGPNLDRVLLGIGLTLLHRKGRATAAYQYLLDVLDVDPEPEVEQAARVAIAEIEQQQKLRVSTMRRGRN